MHLGFSRDLLVFGLLLHFETAGDPADIKGITRAWYVSAIARNICIGTAC